MRRRLTASLLALSSVVLTAAPSRDWTDRQGRTLSAELISVDLDSVLLRVGLRYHRIGLNTLSDGDQTLANEWKKANPRAPRPANLPAVDTADPFALTITPTPDNTTVVTPDGKNPAAAPTATPPPAVDKTRPGRETAGPSPVTAAAPTSPAAAPVKNSPAPASRTAPAVTAAPPEWPAVPVFQKGNWNRELIAAAGLKGVALAFWDANGHLEHHDSLRPTETTRRVIPRSPKNDRILPHPGGFLLSSEGGRLLQVSFNAPTRTIAEQAWLAEARPDGISWQPSPQSPQLIVSETTGKSATTGFKAGAVRDPRKLPDGFAFLERAGAGGPWKLARTDGTGGTVSVPHLPADHLVSSPGPDGVMLLWRDEPAGWQFYSATTGKTAAPVPAASFLPPGWSLGAPTEFAGSARAVLLTARRKTPAATLHLIATLDEEGRPLIFLPVILPPGATACATVE